MTGDRRFLVTGPAAINVSGGRTSGMMLHHILDAHDGKLPPDVFAFFCNTGREMPATLDFVLAMQQHWGVHIQWLEYRRDAETGRTWTEPVNHNSASRHGEPFEMFLAGRSWLLPDPKRRSCTEQLKISAVTRWVRKELRWKWHRRYVGLRYDELHRVMRMAAHNASRKHGHSASCPLAKARMTKLGHVLPFWAAQPFDLQLKGDWEGNCDGCFMKRIAAIRRMTADYPERMAWWAAQEASAVEYGYTHGRFRIDREGYAEIAAQMARSPDFHSLLRPDDTGFDLFASCEGGCGT